MPDVDQVFLHTIAVEYRKSSLQDSFEHLRSIENFHVQSRGWTGIGYSWLIDTRGRIFEGRGLRVPGGHTQGHNSDAYGVAFFGHGDIQPATNAQVQAFADLLRYLVKDVKVVKEDYRIRGHREVSTKSCPGNLIWPLVANKTWAPENVLTLTANPPKPQEPIIGDDNMISVQHLYLEFFGRFGSQSEIAYWEGEFAKNPQGSLTAIADSKEAKDNADNDQWANKIAGLFEAEAALADIKRFLSMRLMTRAGIVDSLLVTTISRQVFVPPPNIPGTVVNVNVDRSAVLKIVADALVESLAKDPNVN